ncbi:MAG: SLATT domain-containing protein [Bacteroidota bacterium]|nr:SLATT domain-containing protein [Bacteroidota bacterium]
MILDWMRKIHQLEYAHRYQSIYYVKAERWLGISAFVIMTLVAFSYRFHKVEPETFQKLPFFLKQEFFVPFASFVAAILTGLITFLRPNERSETHKKTGSNYEKLRHRIELLLTSQLGDTELNKELNEIKKEWDSLDAINVANRYFLRGKEKVKSFKKYPKELDFLNDVVE